MSTARRFGGAGIRRGIRSPSGAAAAWDPSQIAGVFDWWRADLGVTESGGAVSAWEGQVNGSSLVQATASAKPTLTTRDGQSVVSFDGSDGLQGAFTAITQPWTTILVLERTSGLYAQEGIDATHRAAWLANPGWNFIAGVLLDSGATASGEQVIIGEANGASSKVWSDDFTTADITGDAGAQDMAGLTLGRRYDDIQAMTGFIWEAIIIDGATSSDDRAALGAYLEARYPSINALTY